MLKSHFLISALQVLARFLGNIIFFPLWWYSVGFVRFATKILLFWRDEQRSLGLMVWVRNIFVPMYGQNELAGRLISFVMRVVQILARGLMMLFWVVIGLVLMVIWLTLPLALMLATAFQLLAF